MQLPNIQAIIFDLDDTLKVSGGVWAEVDKIFPELLFRDELFAKYTEAQKNQVRSKYFAKSRKHRKNLMAGRTLAEGALAVIDYLSLELPGIDGQKSDLRVALGNRMGVRRLEAATEMYSAGLEWVQGAEDLLQYLHNEHPDIDIAVATAANPKLVESIRPELQPYFNDKIFTVAQAGASKPDPAVFLMAAAALGTSADECLIFEDSVHGIAAANNAGMFCIGVPTHLSKEELLDAGADQAYTFPEVQEELFT